MLVLVLACWTKQEGAVAALVISAGLFLAGNRRTGLGAGLASIFLGIAPWSLVLVFLGSGIARADYAFRSASPGKLVTAGEALLTLGVLPNLPWLLGAAALLALAPGVRVRRRGVLLGAAAVAALFLGAMAFTKLDPAWLVRWSWDRLAFLLVTPLLPVLAEAAAEPLSAP